MIQDHALGRAASLRAVQVRTAVAHDRARLWSLLAAMLCAAPAAGLAQSAGMAPSGAEAAQQSPALPGVPARLGRHDGFIRLAFTWPNVPSYSVAEQPNGRVVIRFAGPQRVDFRSLAATPPRQLRDLELREDGLAFALAPGARLRHAVYGRTVAVDILDPPAPEGPAPTTAARPPAGATPRAASAPAEPPASLPAGPRAEPVAPRPSQPSALPPAGATPRAAPAPAEPPASLPARPSGEPVALRPGQPGAVPPAVEPGADRTPTRPPAGGEAAVAIGAAPLRPEPAGLIGAPGRAGEATGPAGMMPAPPAARGAAEALRRDAPAGATPGQPDVSQPGAPAATAVDPAAESASGAWQSGVASPPAPLRLAFPPGTGAAAVAVGSTLLLVFDSPGDVPVEELRQLAPGFANAGLEVSGVSTQLRLPLEAADRAGIQLLPVGPAWQLGTPTERPPARIGEITGEWSASSAMRRLSLRTGDIGRVVTVRHPTAEGEILIGTVPAGSPARLAAGLPEVDGFELLPTRLGVAVRPLAPGLALRPAGEGFELTVPRLDDRSAGRASAPEPRRLLDLAGLTRPELLKRRQVAVAAAAAAPLAGRSAHRLMLAETLLGLGMGAEAQALVRVALQDEPRLARSPRAILLAGATALLAGRNAEAARPLADARLNGEPEAALWRALAVVLRGGEADAESLAILADPSTPLRTYPAGLRARLLPAAAEALAVAGRLQEAAALLEDAELAHLPRIALARARGHEARQLFDVALASYAELARSRDHFVRATALARSAELGLATGRDDARRAAMQTEAAAMAWRGDAQELGRRLRAAELHQIASQPGAALALLDQTLVLFPEAAPRIRPMTEAIFPAALADPALPLAEAIRLAGRMAADMPPTPQTAAALLTVADRLSAMELPVQAAEVIRLGLARTTDPGSRATLSLRLATAHLAADNPAGALDALAGAPAQSLPAAARDERIRLEAEARRRRGDLAGSAALLRTLGSAGLPALVDVLAAAEDWRGVTDALSTHARNAFPAAPAPLDLAQRRLLVRLAAFASLAGDPGRIEAVRLQYESRMAGGPLADAFLAMLSADAPSRRNGETGDLVSLRRDLATARGVQEQLLELR